MWRSATVQRMVDDLDASDLIVYVSRTALDGTLRGALRLVGAGAAHLVGTQVYFELTGRKL